jgi:DNA-binding transcriptional LysR family regulator
MDLQIRRYDPQIIESKLLSGHLDMAFTTIPARSKIKDFSYIVLEYADYVLVTSKNHPKVNENTSLSDFNGEQAIYYNEENSDDIICRKNFNATWSGYGINVIPSIQCTSLSAAYTELMLGKRRHAVQREK